LFFSYLTTSTLLLSGEEGNVVPLSRFS